MMAFVTAAIIRRASGPCVPAYHLAVGPQRSAIFLTVTTVVVTVALLAAGCGGNSGDPRPVQQPLGPTVTALATADTQDATAASRGFATPADDEFYGNFLTAVARAPSAGFTPYWLGREFPVGGLTFTGPTAPTFAKVVPDVGAVEADYLANIDPKGQVSLQVFSYNHSTWQDDSARPEMEAGEPLQVAGYGARISISGDRLRPVNQIRLMVEFPNAVVLVIAYAGGSKTPGGPDVNPLVNRETFLSVLSHLRPYPQ